MFCLPPSLFHALPSGLPPRAACSTHLRYRLGACYIALTTFRQVKDETIKMTNLQWYKFTYPDNDDLPYMYNEFSWDHCA